MGTKFSSINQDAIDSLPKFSRFNMHFLSGSKTSYDAWNVASLPRYSFNLSLLFSSQICVNKKSKALSGVFFFFLSF